MMPSGRNLHLRRAQFLAGIALIACAGCENVQKFREANRAARVQNILGVQGVRDQKQAESAVVRIFARKEGGRVETGSGIFLGYRGSKAFFITAYHVVGGVGTRMWVEFAQLPGRRFPAELLRSDEVVEGGGTDIAVVEVKNPPSELMQSIVPFESGRAADLGEARDGTLGILLALKEPVAAAPGPAAGARISTVPPGSAGARAGLLAGDLIVSVNQRRVQTAEEAVAAIQAVPAGDAFAMTVRRSGAERVYRFTRRAAAAGSSTLYSIGHPAGPAWTWNAGHLLARESNGTLLVSKELTPGGASGGPLFDANYRVVGVVVARGSDFGIAVDVTRALALVEQWRVPYRFWRSADFCAKLAQVMAHGRTGFEGLRIGAGLRDRTSSGEDWRWEAKIDLSGYRKSYVVREGNRYRFEAEMNDLGTLGIREVDDLRREIATQARKCYPGADVQQDKYSVQVVFRDGPSMWDSVRRIYIYAFGSLVVLRVYRQN